MINEILDKIIKDLDAKAEKLKEISSDTKDSRFLYEAVGILKSIDLVKTYKVKE